MYYIGIDLGGTNIAAGLVNEKGKILHKATIQTKARRPADEIVKDMARLTKELLGKAGISADQVEYAGIATPGTADHDKGVVVYANNLPFLNYPLAAKLSEFSGIARVYIENDANAAAKGEAAWGASQGCRHSIMITLGTGLGGGIMIDNAIYSGFNYAGAELGHVVIEVNGRPCTCGRKGCWESYSSATGLIKTTKEVMRNNPDSMMWEMCGGKAENASGRTAFDAMRKGDGAGKEAVDLFILYLAEGIVNMINIFQPEVLVIGGGLSNEGDYLLNPIKEFIENKQYSKNSENKTEIKIARLGNDAGIIGAAMLGQ